MNSDNKPGQEQKEVEDGKHESELLTYMNLLILLLLLHYMLLW